MTGAGPTSFLGARSPDAPAASTGWRVLMVTDHLQESGGTRVLHEVAGSLPALGVETQLLVLLRPSGERPWVQPPPGTVTSFAVRRAGRLRSALAPGFVKMVRAARRADVVMSGSEIGYSLLMGWLAARLTRRPFAVLVQSSLPHAMDAWVPAPLHRPTRWVHGHADRAICVSEGLVDDLLATGLPADRVSVVPVGVDVDRVVAAAAAGEPVTVPGRYVVGAGRLVAQKGFDVLLRAFARTRRERPDHHLVLLGEGPERAALLALAEELGVGGAVHLPGFVRDPYPTLAGAEAFVLSSRYEGMGGLVLLEALALGLPVVATDCPTGPRSVLEGGALGRLVPVDDPVALADGLAEALELGRGADEVVRRRRDRAREFGPDRWVPAVAEALRLADSPVRG